MPPLSPLAKAWWWARDYLYAARRQLALFSPTRLDRGGRRPPEAWGAGSPALPDVVLVPGVYEHWTFLRPLGDALSEAGHRVGIVHGLGINRRPVGATAARLAHVLAETPPPPSGRVIVAHSKGGLIGKHLLLSPDAGPLGVLGLVAVCTPFGGSSLARLFLIPSIRAFRPKDATIVMLAAEASVNSRIVSVFGRYDPHIPSGSALDGATNVEVPTSGHFLPLGSADTHRAVIDGIALLVKGATAGL